jgi:hypothetical protein
MPSHRHPKPLKPRGATARKQRRRAVDRPWPDPKERGLEPAKWQAWIGYQLSRWRLMPGPEDSFGTTNGLGNKQGASALKYPRDVLSQIEYGFRRVDPVDLLVFAIAYGKTPSDLAKLFSPPSPEAWSTVKDRYCVDPRFDEPPRGIPYPKFRRKQSATGGN